MNVLEVRRALRKVPRELRTPLMYVPVSVTNYWVLRAARRAVVTRTRVEPGVVLREERVGHVPVNVYEPASRNRPSAALVWVHGGGLIAGGLAQDHDLCSRIAAELGVLVVSVDYRLAPEHPFPAGLDDCHAVLSWLLAQATTLDVDPSRVAVGGASAGGGLAAALAQRAHDEGLPLCLQLLVYPMLDDRTALRDDHDGRDLLVWTNGSNKYGWTSYLGRPPAAEQTPPAYAVPARREDLAGLPPAWIGVGDRDLFLDEDVEYAERLRAAGVRCDLVVIPGMPHGADTWSTAPATTSFRKQMVQALGEAFVART